MGFYEQYLLPKLLNLIMKTPEMTRLRRQLIPLAHGEVLEVGVGSGLNLPFYGQGVRVTGVDPSLELQAYARQVATTAGCHAQFIAESAESLPMENNRFDSAVITWSLCTIPDPAAALAEVRRVLKPAGKLIFVEHGAAPDANVAKWQGRINPTWRRLAGGCHLNRRPDTTLSEAGFTCEDMVKNYIPGPRFATYTYRGVASVA